MEMRIVNLDISLPLFEEEALFDGELAQNIENGLFTFLSASCARNAFVCFVIGRSKIHGRIVENEKIIAKIGESKGLKHLSTIKRTIKSSRKSFNLSHARIKEEFIVILQK